MSDTCLLYMSSSNEAPGGVPAAECSRANRNSGEQTADESQCQKEVEALTEAITEACKKLNAASFRMETLLDENSALQARLDAADSVVGGAHEASSALGRDRESSAALISFEASNSNELELLPEGTALAAERQQHPAFPSTFRTIPSCEIQAQLEPPLTTQRDSRELSAEAHVDARMTDMHRCESKPSAQQPQQQQMTSRHCHRPSPIWRPEEDDPMHDRPETSSRAAVSYTLVAASAPTSARAAVLDPHTHHEWYLRAQGEYLHQAAAALNRTPRDISWVTQFPYDVDEGRPLSCCGVAAGLPSALSLALAHTAVTFECLILEAEHEYLERCNSTNCSSSNDGGCASEGLHNSSLLRQLIDDAAEADESACAPVDTFPAPDKRLTTCMHVHCGLEDSCALAQAVRGIVHTMLRRRCVLPPRVWKAACMRIMRCVKTTVDGQRRQMPGADSELLEVFEEGAQPPLSMVNQGLKVAMEMLLHEVCGALKQDLQQGGSSRGGELGAVHARMLHVGCFLSLVGPVALIRSPRASMMMLGRSHTVPGGHVQADRLSMKTITSMAFTAEQNIMHAEKWYTWVRRRKALSRNLLETLASMELQLPQRTDLQLALLCAVMHLPVKPVPVAIAPHSVDSDYGGSTVVATSASPHIQSVLGQGVSDVESQSTNITESDSSSGSPTSSAEGKQSVFFVGYGMYDHADAPAVRGRQTVSGSLEAQLDTQPSEASTRGGSLMDASLMNADMHEVTSVMHALPALPPVVAPDHAVVSALSTQLIAQHAPHCEHAPKVRGKVLGESGADMHALEECMRDLVQCSHQDLLLIASREGMFNLTPVQLAMVHSANVKYGAPKIDVCRIWEVAAHGAAWKDLFVPLRIIE